MEAPRFAFVTLCTSDAYLPGALVTLHSVLDVEPASPLQREWTTVALTTPATVGHSTVQALSKAFDVVIGVESIVTQSWEELKLLGASVPSVSACRVSRLGRPSRPTPDPSCLAPRAHLSFNCVIDRRSHVDPHRLHLVRAPTCNHER